MKLNDSTNMKNNFNAKRDPFIQLNRIKNIVKAIPTAEVIDPIITTVKKEIADTINRFKNILCSL